VCKLFSYYQHAWNQSRRCIVTNQLNVITQTNHCDSLIKANFFFWVCLGGTQMNVNSLRWEKNIIFLREHFNMLCVFFLHVQTHRKTHYLKLELHPIYRWQAIHSASGLDLRGWKCWDVEGRVRLFT
jgi:hypothetical protein